MRRRDFITLLGGAGVAWPLGARAQQSERHVVVLMPQSEDDSDSHALSTAFAQSHMQRGSTSGGNVRVDLRWAIDNPDKVKAAIAELQAHPARRHCRQHQPDRCSAAAGDANGAARVHDDL
jgi:putative ABC transport system substrate-binding protein